MTDLLRGRRIEGLDILRGIAVLLVIASHAMPTRLEGGGIVGVIVFFTLSGYLITGVLMKDLVGRGKVRYGRFYRNRALRLIPALIFMLLGLSIVTVLFDPLGDRHGLLRGIAVALTYTANIPFDHGSTAIAHLWTLATEEQFYLVWPLILAVGLKFRRLKLVVVASGFLILLACVGTLVVSSDDISRIYPLPTSWALTMVIGAAARLGQDRLATILPGVGRGRTVLSSVALALILAMSFSPSPVGWPAAYLIGGPFIAVLAVVLIFHLRTWQRIPVRGLRPLLSLGTISYAAYLWNYPISLWVGTHDNQPVPAVASVVLTIAAAGLSWRVAEKPVQTWRAHLDAKAATRSSAPVSTSV